VLSRAAVSAILWALLSCLLCNLYNYCRCSCAEQIKIHIFIHSFIHMAPITDYFCYTCYYTRCFCKFCPTVWWIISDYSSDCGILLLCGVLMRTRKCDAVGRSVQGVAVTGDGVWQAMRGWRRDEQWGAAELRFGKTTPCETTGIILRARWCQHTVDKIVTYSTDIGRIFTVVYPTNTRGTIVLLTYIAVLESGNVSYLVGAKYRRSLVLMPF